jgi:hypothetical protein
VPRKPGPEKRQVLIRIPVALAAKLEAHAREKYDETLPAYLSRNVEASAAKLR